MDNFMDPVTIPLLYCPLSPAINPFAAEAARHTDEWVKRFNLHTGPAYLKYQKDNFAWLTARFYPGAGQEKLKIANDFIVLLFVFDDLLDHQHVKAPLIQKQENLHDFIDKFIAITRNRAAIDGQDGHPLLAAWAELWPRIISISPPAWVDRFTQSMEALLKAAIWEFNNVRSQLPTLAQYMEKRPCLAGAHVGSDIIPVIEEIWLPDEVRQHPVVTELEQLARNLVCWANDLFSLSKEQAHGDEHNLVSILVNERQLTLDEAIVCAAAIHNTDMRKFVTLSGDLPVYDETTNQSLKRFVESLRRLIRGNVDWSERDSKRYSFVYAKR